MLLLVLKLDRAYSTHPDIGVGVGAGVVVGDGVGVGVGQGPRSIIVYPQF
jgi:hypothetical protein